MGATKLEGANGSVTLVSNNPTDNYILTVPNANGTMALTSDLKEIGVGQTWQNVTASRVSGTTYTNSTGKPIQVNVHYGSTNGLSSTILFATVDGVTFNFALNTNSGGGVGATGNFIVPEGSTYSVNNMLTWYELR
jgi:hypothetical protein